MPRRARASRQSSWPQTGETITYRELEARSNRLAHLPARPRPEPSRPLRDPDGEQRALRGMPAAPASARASTYTCVNSYLTPDELAYIVTNSQSRILITSQEKRETAREGASAVPAGRGRASIVDGPGDEPTRSSIWTRRRRACRHTPIADEYASARRCSIRPAPPGRPKGIRPAACRSSRRRSNCRCSIS
jgi:long-chain acyl-CoA synthetase